MSDRYGAATTDTPQKVTDLPGQAPFEGDQIATRELLGSYFQIHQARRMTSTKGKGKGGPGYFYLCQIKRADGKLYRALLGGVAVVPVLDAWLDQPSRGPLEVKLSEVEGGDFGKYYVLE